MADTIATCRSGEVPVLCAYAVDHYLLLRLLVICTLDPAHRRVCYRLPSSADTNTAVIRHLQVVFDSCACFTVLGLYKYKQGRPFSIGYCILRSFLQCPCPSGYRLCAHPSLSVVMPNLLS